MFRRFHGRLHSASTSKDDRGSTLKDLSNPKRRLNSALMSSFRISAQVVTRISRSSGSCSARAINSFNAAAPGDITGSVGVGGGAVVAVGVGSCPQAAATARNALNKPLVRMRGEHILGGALRGG